MYRIPNLTLNTPLMAQVQCTCGRKLNDDVSMQRHHNRCNKALEYTRRLMEKRSEVPVKRRQVEQEKASLVEVSTDMLETMPNIDDSTKAEVSVKHRKVGKEKASLVEVSNDAFEIMLIVDSHKKAPEVATMIVADPPEELVPVSWEALACGERQCGLMAKSP